MVVIPIHRVPAPPNFGYGIAVTCALPLICGPPVRSAVEHTLYTVLLEIWTFTKSEEGFIDYGLITLEDQSLRNS